MDSRPTTIINHASEPQNIVDIRMQEIAYAFELPDLFYTTVDIATDISPQDLIQTITEIVGKPLLKMQPCLNFLTLEYDKLILGFNIYHIFENKMHPRAIEAYGALPEIERLHKAIMDRFHKAPDEKPHTVRWFFTSDGHVNSQFITMKEKNVPHDCFYPWIPEGLNAFYEGFLASDANVLLMIGNPGSGKSSLIRDLIIKKRLNTIITYEEELMTKDSFFFQFLTSDADVLVAEDADVFIRDRAVNNRIMNKLLNSSDGLISTNKKIIFTANITHMADVDGALTRPGRCFRALTFRDLTHLEMARAAKEMGVACPDKGGPLSMLFRKDPVDQVPQRLGFAIA